MKGALLLFDSHVTALQECYAKVTLPSMSVLAKLTLRSHFVTVDIVPRLVAIFLVWAFTFVLNEDRSDCRQFFFGR